MTSSKKQSPSTHFCIFSVFACTFLTPQHSDHGNDLFSDSYIHLGHIFLPSSKIFKIVDTRSFNVQRHHPNSDFENLQCKCSYKRFCDFWKSLFWVMSPRWTTVRQQFWIFLNLVKNMTQVDVWVSKNTVSGVWMLRSQKTPRVDWKNFKNVLMVTVFSTTSSHSIAR